MILLMGQVVVRTPSALVLPLYLTDQPAICEAKRTNSDLVRYFTKGENPGRSRGGLTGVGSPVYVLGDAILSLSPSAGGPPRDQLATGVLSAQALAQDVCPSLEGEAEPPAKDGS